MTFSSFLKINEKYYDPSYGILKADRKEYELVAFEGPVILLNNKPTIDVQIVSDGNPANHTDEFQTYTNLNW